MSASRILMGASLLGVLSGPTGSSSAQRVQDTVHLGLSLPVLAYVDATAEGEAGVLTLTSETSGVSWGIQSDAVLELGYGVSEMIVIGGLLRVGGMSFSGDDTDDESVTVTEVLIAPTAEVLMSPGASVRPFLGASAGLASVSISSGGSENSALGLQLLGRAGLRWFAAPAVSMDLAVGVHWRTASGESGSENLETDVSRSSVGVALLLGVSGWAG